MIFYKFTNVDKSNRYTHNMERTIPRVGDLIRNVDTTEYINIVLGVSTVKRDNKGHFVYIRSVRYARYSKYASTQVKYIKGLRSRSFKYYISSYNDDRRFRRTNKWSLVKLQKATKFIETTTTLIEIVDDTLFRVHLPTQQKPRTFVDVDDSKRRAEIVNSLKDVDTTYKAPENN
jgi:hypothetical protein